MIAAFEGLLAIRHLHLEQNHLVRQALEAHRQGMDFADALHLVRSEGCQAMISFDRSMAALVRNRREQVQPGKASFPSWEAAMDGPHP